MQQSMPNPALKNLDILVGEWTTEVSNIPFLSDPSAKVRSQNRFEWFEGGAFLIAHSSAEQSVFPSAVMVIGRDDSVETYSVLYFDSRGVSRVYYMSLEDGVWKMWRNAPGFSQRFTGKFSGDGKTIIARWEKSTDGSNWEHDFDLTYYRKDR